MNRIASYLLVGLLLAPVSACGPELVGGSQTGDVEATMTDEPGSTPAANRGASGPTFSLSPEGTSPQLAVEGTLSADVSVELLAGAAAIPITAGVVTGTVGIGSTDEVTLGRRDEVEVDVYPGVRVTFTRVDAQIAAASGTGPLIIRVDLGAAPLVMEVPVEVVVRRNELSTVELDLNGAVWLPLANPVTGLVSREAFAAAVAVRVE